MNKAEVKEILSKINYPGFSRDIISFGMVKDIIIENDGIIINLTITSNNVEKIELVSNNIKKELSQFFSSVIVNTKNADTNKDSSSSSNLDSENNALSNIKHVIAVASGKGGVGKSTVASNIACGLMKRGNKVGLLDLDIYGPSLPIIFGINQKPEMTKDNKLIPIKIHDMKVMSFGFISGNDTPVIWRGPLISRMTEQFFKDVDWGELDYLILDLPPGTGDVQLTLTQKLRMSGALIVTTPQDIALSDVKKGADMFNKVKTPILGVLENMSGFNLNGLVLKEGKVINGGNIKFSNGSEVIINEDGTFDANISLFKEGGGLSESKRLNIPLLGTIPFSPDIVISTDDGEPIILKDPSHFSSKLYFSIVDKLVTIIN